MPEYTPVIIFNLIFFPLCFFLPYMSGLLVSRSGRSLEKKIRNINILTFVSFIMSIIIWFSLRETLSISHLVLEYVSESWGALILYFIVFIAEIVLINTLTLSLPRFFLHRKLRNTSQKAFPDISRKALIMVLQLLTWILLWLGYTLLQALFPEPWILYPLLAVWVWLVLIAVQRMLRSLMIPRKDRNLEQEKVLFPLVQVMAHKAGIRLHRVVYLSTTDSKIANAWAWGGLKPMITLYDYLYENMDEAEREIVIYHELGHIRLHHTLIRVLITVATLTLSLFLIQTFLTRFADLDTLVIFIVSQLIILVCTFFLPAFLYRYQEHQADLFALTHCSDPTAFSRALFKLSALNHSAPAWKKGRSLVSTHPHILGRIEWLRKKTGLDLPAPPEFLEND